MEDNMEGGWRGGFLHSTLNSSITGTRVCFTSISNLEMIKTCETRHSLEPWMQFLHRFILKLIEKFLGFSYLVCISFTSPSSPPPLSEITHSVPP